MIYEVKVNLRAGDKVWPEGTVHDEDVDGPLPDELAREFDLGTGNVVAVGNKSTTPKIKKRKKK